jgi:membrane protein YdbS with pleckstrin-like domain
MIGPQPRGREGTSDRPYSALNLRLVLALFGLAAAIVAGVFFWQAGLPVWTVVAAGVLAVTTLVNLFVVIARRRARHRQDPSQTHSIFE